MVLIIDTELSLRALKLRKAVVSSGIPCAATGFAHFYDYTPAKVIVIFIDTVDNFINKYDYNDPEMLILADGESILDDCCVFKEMKRVVDRILDVSIIKYGINFDSYFADRYTEVGGVSRFIGKPIILTDTEKIIIRHLSINPERRYSAKEIADYCIMDVEKNASYRNVSVQISNINRKVNRIASKKLIRSCNHSGYEFIYFRRPLL